MYDCSASPERSRSTEISSSQYGQEKNAQAPFISTRHFAQSRLFATALFLWMMLSCSRIDHFETCGSNSSAFILLASLTKSMICGSQSSWRFVRLAARAANFVLTGTLDADLIIDRARGA